MSGSFIMPKMKLEVRIIRNKKERALTLKKLTSVCNGFGTSKFVVCKWIELSVAVGVHVNCMDIHKAQIIYSAHEGTKEVLAS